MVISRLILLTCSFSPVMHKRGDSKAVAKRRFTYQSLIKIWVWRFCRALSFCLRSISRYAEPEIPPPQPTQSVSWVLHGGRWRAFPMRRLHSAQALSLGKAVSTE
jgi:hypothetical protein